MEIFSIADLDTRVIVEGNKYLTQKVYCDQIQKKYLYFYYNQNLCKKQQYQYL